MTDSSRLTALYADDLNTQREQVARRAALRGGSRRRRTTRATLASGLHRLADHLE